MGLESFIFRNFCIYKNGIIYAHDKCSFKLCHFAPDV